MEMNFIPKNEFEKQLLQVQNGEMSTEVFLQKMLGARLYMPVLNKNETWVDKVSKAARPLTIEDEFGIKLVVLFSSPERANLFVQAFPGYGEGVLADISLIIKYLAVGDGVIINPGYDVSLELEAEMLEQLVKN